MEAILWTFCLKKMNYLKNGLDFIDKFLTQQV